MNISDNSTKKLDIATLERFTHYRLEPQWGKEYALFVCTKHDAPNEVLDALLLISESMVVINNAISKERLLGPDKVIGTRSISGISLDKASLTTAIINQLLPEVEDRASKCEDNKNGLNTEIEKIKKAIV